MISSKMSNANPLEVERLFFKNLYTLFREIISSLDKLWLDLHLDTIRHVFKDLCPMKKGKFLFLFLVLEKIVIFCHIRNSKKKNNFRH